MTNKLDKPRRKMMSSENLQLFKIGLFTGDVYDVWAERVCYETYNSKAAIRAKVGSDDVFVGFNPDYCINETLTADINESISKAIT